MWLECWRRETPVRFQKSHAQRNEERRLLEDARMKTEQLNRRNALMAMLVATAGMMVAQPAQSLRANAPKTETAVFAGGCFWGIQAVFQHIKGVKSAISGYSGGSTDKPGYEMVSTGVTGHAESVQVVFDPAQVSYATLLKVFFSVAHDPTELNRQGPDVGTQYRSSPYHMSD